MPAALTPVQALRYLRELSADTTAVLVLDGDGNVLAGPPGGQAAARSLLELAPPGPAELQGRTQRGAVFAARDDAHQIVVATGPLVLPGLTRHDLRSALTALGGRTTAPSPPIDAPDHLVEPLLGRF
jgi:hypothetical protein